MRFDRLIILALAAVALMSCEARPIGIGGDDGLIGEQLSKLSSLSKSDGSAQSTIGIFDETSRRIHLFDLEKKEVATSVSVVETSSQSLHFVLYDAAGEYLVDITTFGFAIIKKNNVIVPNPVVLYGKPRSAAFRPDQGLLVIYDDVGSIGIIKLSPYGDILQSWVGGSRLDPLDPATVQAGDLIDNGHLLTSLSDGQLADIDLAQTLNTRNWVFTLKPTGLKAAKWVSKVSQHPNQVFFRVDDGNKRNFYLYDLATEAILDTYQAVGNLEKASRGKTAHVFVTSEDKQYLEVIFPQALELKSLRQSIRNVLTSNTIHSSYLDLNRGVLSLVEVNTPQKYMDNAFYANLFRQERIHKKFRLSDMLMTSTLNIPNDANLEISNQYVLALFPHKLGYAISYDVENKTQHEFRFFNRGHLKK